MITKKELTELIAKGYSLRDIAKLKGVSHTLVAKWCKKYKLNTIFSIYKPIKRKPKKIFLKEDIDYFLDISSISIRQLRGKHRREIPYSYLSLRNNKTNEFIFYFFKVKESKVTTNDVKIALNSINQIYPLNLNGVFCVDSKHNKLKSIIKITNLKGWSAKKNLAEKTFGLKSNIYPYLRFLMDLLNIKKIEDLTQYPNLVLKTYVHILSIKHKVITTQVDDVLKKCSLKWIHQITN